MFSRRVFIQSSCAGFLAGLLPRVVFGDEKLGEGLRTSDLIYLTPIKSNGDESRCQSEIWFVFDGVNLFICTGSETWRARAVKKGLDRARVWVGDLGTWRKTGGKYKTLPKLEAKGTVVDDKADQEKVLELYGDKYTMGWIVYESRFREGLANGSRTMIRYTPLTI